MSRTNLPGEGRPRPTWYRSSYSNGAGGECVEYTLTAEGALVRDSKRRDGPVLAVRGRAWHQFIGFLNAEKQGRAT